MKPEDIQTGLSAFNNSYWSGIFYPEGLSASRRFEFYCQHFNTYEINASFYKFPTVKGLKSWYGKTPEDFQFCIKANKVITHFKRFNNCAREIDDFYNTSQEGLQDKLACVLFQLPPSFNYSEERLEMVVSAMNPDFTNVVEFRHETWWRQEVYDRLQAHNIIFCSVSYPKLPADIIATAPTGYVRLHGTPKLFYSEYTREELQQVHRDILCKNFSKTFVFFNNTASNAGILNAMEFKNF